MDARSHRRGHWFESSTAHHFSPFKLVISVELLGIVCAWATPGATFLQISPLNRLRR